MLARYFYMTVVCLVFPCSMAGTSNLEVSQKLSINSEQEVVEELDLFFDEVNIHLEVEGRLSLKKVFLDHLDFIVLIGTFEGVLMLGDRILRSARRTIFVARFELGELHWVYTLELGGCEELLDSIDMTDINFVIEVDAPTEDPEVVGNPDGPKKDARQSSVNTDEW